MKCAIYLEDKNPINVFSANAIRAGRGTHSYEIICNILIGLNYYVINRSNENRYHFIIHGSGGYI
jgi:hypothetical protein